MLNKAGFGVCVFLGVLSKIAELMGGSAEVQQMCYDLGVVGMLMVLCFLLFIQTKDKYLWLAALVLVGMDIANLFINVFKITFMIRSSS